MKYVYVVSEQERCVAIIDFSDKTVMNLVTYGNGDFELGQCFSWNEEIEYPFLEYNSVEEILLGVNEKDWIFTHDLKLSEQCKKSNKKEYLDWQSNWTSCFKLIQEMYRPELSIDLKN